MLNAVVQQPADAKEINVGDEKRVTLTIRLTETEKREADACASYLGLPLSTFFRFAARQVFNENRGKMVETSLWEQDSSQPQTELIRQPSQAGGES
jgi:hypothetical protein